MYHLDVSAEVLCIIYRTPCPLHSGTIQTFFPNQQFLKMGQKTKFDIEKSTFALFKIIWINQNILNLVQISEKDKAKKQSDILLTNFFTNYFTNFLTFNLSTVASLRIGVPWILFFSKNQDTYYSNKMTEFWELV